MKRLTKVLLIFGFVCLILGFVSFRIVADNPMPFPWAFVGLAVASFIAALFIDAPFFREVAGMRTTKHGLNLGVVVVLVTALLVGVNFIAVKRVKKFDLTKNKINSLSDQTRTVLHALDEDLKVMFFYDENALRFRDAQNRDVKQQFKELIDLYSAESKFVKVTYVDIKRRPDLGKEHGITMAGTIKFDYKGRNTKTEEFTEQAITNSIIKIRRDQNKVIYFLSGHGERELDGTSSDGLQGLKKYLTDSSYEVKSLSLAQQSKIPADAALLVIAGPKQAFLDGELAALSDYAYNGGKFFIALDPGSRSNISKFVRSLGVEFRDNYVLDPAGQALAGSATVAIGLGYSPTSEITKKFGGMMTGFQLASALAQASDRPATVVLEDLVKTNEAAIAQKDLADPQGKKTLKADAKSDRGPLVLAIQSSGKLVEKPGKGAPQDFQAVVVGDSDFLTNYLIEFQLNHDLILNSIAQLASDKDLVSIRTKETDGSNLIFTQIQANLMFWGFVLVIPLMLLAAGGTVWLRRRAA
ncbi:MAG: GldG family protein [Oligoflexia bacterium]|nr:GldG family protein [Oligoflexia bacterium]